MRRQFLWPTEVVLDGAGEAQIKTPARPLGMKVSKTEVAPNSSQPDREAMRPQGLNVGQAAPRPPFWRWQRSSWGVRRARLAAACIHLGVKTEG